MVGTNKSLDRTDGEEISATPRKIRRVFRSGRPGENVEPLQTFVRPVGLRKMRLASQAIRLRRAIAAAHRAGVNFTSARAQTRGGGTRWCAIHAKPCK